MKKLLTGLSLLISFSFSSTATKAQSNTPAPNISYPTPQTYKVNSPITLLVPANKGGAVSSVVYVSTLAGHNSNGPTDGLGATAGFINPYSVVTDAAGNVFVAEKGHNAIRKVTPAGLVTTIAGSGAFGFDDGLGKAATFNSPNGIAIDASGNLYVADSGNNLIRKVTPGGLVTTIAGGGASVPKDGIGKLAGFNTPVGIGVDALDNIYVSESDNLIRKITAGGVVTTIAGNGSPGYKDGQGSTAEFNNPINLAIDASGNIYVTDAQNNTIRKVSPQGAVSRFAGNGLAYYADGIGVNVSFNAPVAITVDQVGNFYVFDSLNGVIRKINTNGKVTTIAGTPGSTGYRDGIATDAVFGEVCGLTTDNFGNLYVGDELNDVIRKVSLVNYSIDKTLPPGLIFDTATGTISGIPTAQSPATNYTITAYNKGGSSGTVVNMTVTGVPPVITTTTPTGTITTCAGTPSASPAIQQFTVSGTGLTGDITATAPAGFEVSLSSGNGFTNSIIISQAAGSVSNMVIYVRAAAATTGNISGNVVLTSAGATSQNVAVTGGVHALPTLNPVDNQTVINGSATTAVNFTGTGNAAYSWTNNTPGIGLPASGTGDIASFSAVNLGSNPVTATITATPLNAGYAYISNYGSGTVSVINTATHLVSATIPVGVNPQGVSVSSDGSRAYVVNEQSNNVSVINTASNAVVATVPVGTNPIAVSVAPDGRYVYVSNVFDGTVSVITTSTNTVTATIPGFNQPYFLAASPTANLLYVANSPLGTVSVVNTTTNAIEKTITVGADPIQIVFKPDGSKAYVTNESGNSVSVINTVTNTVTATIPVGNKPYGASVSPDGNLLYISSPNEGTVTVINTNTDQIIKSINIGHTPVGISVTGDSKYVYVVNNESPGKVSIIDAATNMIIATVPVGLNPNSLGNFIIAGANCSGIPIKFTITVNPSPPLITATGTLSALTTVYGTPSASASFTVSGVNLPAGILVTPPAGFEVSTDNINYSSTVTVETAGNTAQTPVYFRLAATTGAGTYPGNFVFTSGNVSPVNIEVPNGTVKPAPLTITANNAGKYPGTTLINTSGSIYYTVTGLQNGDQIGTAIITYGPGAAADAASGTYLGSVVVSGATGGTFNPVNYIINYVPGDITVYESQVTSLSVTGNLSPLNTVYGTPSSSLSFTVTAANLTAGVLITPPSGFELSTDNNTFSSTITIGTTGTLPAILVYIRLAASAVVGTYSGNIVLSSPGVTDGILNMPVSTVTPALLTVSADNKTKVYGTPNPSLTVTYTGFVNNDGPNQLTYQPLITTTAVTTSPYGEYLINASGAASPNYTFTYVPGYLTVAPSSQALVIPNAFTPNGDGINDSWDIKYLDYYPDCTVNIFTRYGENVYQSVSYPVPWDGRYKGSALPTGVYYYIINLKNGTGLLSGNVTIIR